MSPDLVTRPEIQFVFLLVEMCKKPKTSSINHVPHLGHRANVSEAIIVCPCCATRIPTEWWNWGSDMFNPGNFPAMLKLWRSSSFNNPSQPCVQLKLLLESSEQLLKKKTSNPLRKICIASHKKCKTGSTNSHLQHLWVESWCTFQSLMSLWPEASNFTLREASRLIHLMQMNQNKKRYTLPAMMEAAPDSCGSSIPTLPEEYSTVHVSRNLCVLQLEKKSPTWVATGMTDNAKIYGLDLDLEVISWSFVHHFITLKDNYVELIITNPPPMGISGMRLENIVKLMAAQQRSQPLAKLKSWLKAPKMLIIWNMVLGINY